MEDAVEAGESTGTDIEAWGSSNQPRAMDTDAAAFTPIPANGGDRDEMAMLKRSTRRGETSVVLRIEWGGPYIYARRAAARHGELVDGDEATGGSRHGQRHGSTQGTVAIVTD